MGKILYKYLGLDGCHPRTTFLDDGLFRITQPRFLNDKHSESRLKPYFNEFSPADLDWARREHAKSQVLDNYVPSDADLIRLHLEPMSKRYIDAFPHMLSMLDEQVNFDSVDDYDYHEHEKLVEKVNDLLVSTLSCFIGVLSLTVEDCNRDMWGRYGAEGRGIVVGFDSDADFFKQYSAKPVSYNPTERGAITYYKGIIRIFGYPAQDFSSLFGGSTGSFFKDYRPFEALFKGLFLTKEEYWSYEEETRLVIPLSESDVQSEDDIDFEIPKEIVEQAGAGLVQHHKEVCLKKIPFETIQSLTLGYEMTQAEKQAVKDKVESTVALRHIELFETKVDIYGQIKKSPVN